MTGASKVDFGIKEPKVIFNTEFSLREIHVELQQT